MLRLCLSEKVLKGGFPTKWHIKFTNEKHNFNLVLLYNSCLKTLPTHCLPILISSEAKQKVDQVVKYLGNTFITLQKFDPKDLVQELHSGC